jgi:hypothetical protein
MRQGIGEEEKMNQDYLNSIYHRFDVGLEMPVITIPLSEIS